MITLDCSAQLRRRSNRQIFHSLFGGHGVRDNKNGRFISSHGYFGTRVYRIWQGLKTRSTNKNNKDAARYIDRGIDIDPRWLEFTVFLSDMGEPPTDKHSIEREDNLKGYWPDNCCWATSHAQTRNRRSNAFVEYKGENLCVQDWAKRVGITHAAMRHRLKKWSLDKALTTPPIPPSERRSHGI